MYMRQNVSGINKLVVMLKTVKIILFILVSHVLYGQNNYYIGCDNNNLIYADYSNCSYQIVCNTGLTMFDIALTPNQTLYSTDGKKIYRINQNNCNNTLITPNPIPDTLLNMGDWMTSLVALDDNFIFAATSGAILYKIDVTNGNYIIVDTIKQYNPVDSLTYYFGSGGDLTWYKNNLLFVTSANDLVQISLNNTYDNITDIKNIGHLNTPNGSIYGALTIGQTSCSADNLKVLAFEFSDVYEVNPQNASLQIKCPNIFPCTANGATSLTEVQIQDYSSAFTMPNVFTPNGDNVNDFLKPAEEKNIVNINIQIYNRWGQIVYQSNSTSFSWDGKNIEQKNNVDGVYYYIVHYKNICDETKTINGFITLIN